MKTSWIDIPENSDFSLANLPYGLYELNGQRSVGMAIGKKILNLTKLIGSLKEESFYSEALESSLKEDSLNTYIGLGKAVHLSFKKWIQQELSSESSRLREMDVFDDQSEVKMLMPVEVGDYTDFYSSRDHATNVGKMFRDPENALLPNWLHMPVGYHGRSSSIVISGTPLHRPCGQILPKGEEAPIYAPCRLLDFELEMAFIIGKNSTLGHRVSTGEAEDYIFGMVLFNDWSARDIQKWEYVPLGPFLGKSWGSSISPWIVTMDALDPYRCDGPKQDPEVLSYLKYEKSTHYDIDLSVYLQTPDGSETEIVHSNYKNMYWSMSQQLAHHTVNGCNVRIGDMMASGTISGQDQHSFGSMLELSWAGSREIKLANGETRKFLKDGDRVIMKGFSGQGENRVGFGEVRTRIEPALEPES